VIRPRKRLRTRGDPNTADSVNIDAVLANANRLLPEFCAAVEAMPPRERGRGIFVSEMFLFYSVVRPLNPRRILESGRALGGSTLTLAHCFPKTRIVSVEFARHNAAIALAKLAPHPNVECLFGDSRRVLPKLLEPADPVLIDGPKEFRALKLALRLLRTRKPSVVFLHDFGAGSPWRQFLDHHWPGAFFSDHPEFLRQFSWLDDVGQTQRDWRRPRPTTFACLPASLPAFYHALLTKIVFSRAASVAPAKTRGLFRRLFP
jgi:predicted O-methyltransferase YrrM